MRDGWLVAIHTHDPMRLTQVRSIVEELRPVAVEELEE